MKSIGYWVPQDAPLKDNTLIYILVAREPRSCDKELGGVPDGSGLGEGQGGI